MRGNPKGGSMEGGAWGSSWSGLAYGPSCLLGGCRRKGHLAVENIDIPLARMGSGHGLLAS